MENFVTTTQQMLDDRYGRVRRRGRVRAFWVIVAVVAVSGFGWIGWNTVSRAMSTVTADDLGYEVHDESRVSVTFQFTAPRDHDVVCFVEAQDEEHGIVGWKTLEFAPDGDHVQQHTVEIPTTALATVGLVNSCQVI